MIAAGGIGGRPAPTDAFSRLRVSNPDSLFESTFHYDLDPMRFNAIVANGGTITHLPLEASAQLATIASAGSSAVLQSRAYHRYLPAKSQLIVMTFVLGAPVAGIVRRAGYFDANDGIFLEQNGVTDVAVVRRSRTSGAPVDARVVQASWNLDQMNGAGGSANPSGLTLNLTNCQILVIDLQWLGMGRVRIGFDIDGEIVYVHEFRNANVLTVPYMATASLPVRWEQAGNGAATMKACCSSVISEGGAEHDSGFLFSAGTPTVRTFTAGTPLPLLAVRPAATFKGLTNRLQLVLDRIALLATSGAADYAWQVLHDCTITGGAWAAPHAESAAEVNVTGTAVSGGRAIAQGHDLSIAANRIERVFDMKKHRLPWCVDGAGTQITLAVVGIEASGSSDIFADMTWRELR